MKSMSSYALVLTLAAVFLVSCVSGPAPNDRFAADPIQPVLYFPFDGNLHAYGAHAIPAGVRRPVPFGPGIVGMAARFDGLGASLEMNDGARLGIVDALTLEMWVNMPEWQNPNKESAHIETVAALSIIFNVSVNFDTWEVWAGMATSLTNDGGVVLKGGRVRPGAWHHLALTWSDANGKAVLYLDGEQVAEQPLAGKLPTGQGLPFVVGTWFENNQAYHGLIDELRVYDVCLDPLVIRAHAASP